MPITIDRLKVISTSMDHLLQRVNDRYKFRMSKSTGEHYRLLTYLSWQFNGARFLDLGTRSGASALCLADNPSNQVVSIDVTHQFKQANDFDFSGFNNITFVKDNVNNLTSPYFKPFDLILIDLEHQGDTEERILRQLDKIGFSGLLIMDDINYGKYRTLQAIWSKIDKPKRVLEYAHHSGTGLVSYGTEVNYIES